MVNRDSIKKKIFENINDEVISFFRESIKIPSITTNEKKYGEFIYKKMYEIGFDKLEMFYFKPNRPDICGILNGSGGGRSLMFVGHIDTVHVDGWKEYWKGADFRACKNFGPIYKKIGSFLEYC